MSDYREQLAIEAMSGEASGAEFDRMRREDALVKYLVKRFGLWHMTRELQERSEEFNRLSFLSLEAFNELFPRFPFRLSYHTLRNMPLEKPERKTTVDYVIHLDPDSVEPVRFKRFTQVPFVVLFRRLLAASPPVKPLCLVFPRKGINHGMCIHNEQNETYWSSGLCWVYKSPDGGQRFYVQPFPALVDGMGPADTWIENKG